MQRRRVLADIVCCAIVALAGTGAPAMSQTDAVVVFAAASLKDAFDAIAAAWRKETGKAATISYGASSTLAKQIENGAPAELFISADLDWMNYLEQRQLIEPPSRLNLLGNSLVLIAPADSTARGSITPGFPLAALLGDGRLAMADPASVPAGKYGRVALQRLAVWSSVEKRIAAAETVRAALALVARGEAPLGVVYQTDAAAEPGVRIVATFPPDTHPPIVYPMALTRTAGAEARAFAVYLRGLASRALFEAQGFTVLDRAR